MAYEALVGFLRGLIQTVTRGVSSGSYRLGPAVILAVRKVDFGFGILRVLWAGIKCL